MAGRKKQIEPEMRFGRLRVLEYPERVEDTNNYKVLVECDCGNVKDLYVSNLSRGAKTPTRSCGCLRKEAAQITLALEEEQRDA